MKATVLSRVKGEEKWINKNIIKDVYHVEVFEDGGVRLTTEEGDSFYFSPLNGKVEHRVNVIA